MEKIFTFFDENEWCCAYKNSTSVAQNSIRACEIISSTASIQINHLD